MKIALSVVVRGAIALALVSMLHGVCGQNPLLHAQEPEGGSSGTPAAKVPVQGAEAKPIIEYEALPKDLVEVLDPVFEALKSSRELRATVKVEVTSSVGDELLGKNEGVFQLASRSPNLLALSAKFDSESVKIVSDGEQLSVQLSPDAYVQMKAPSSLVELTESMPLQLGPQPELLFWLTMAGIDSRMNVLTGLVELSRVTAPEAAGDNVVRITGTRVEGIRWALDVQTTPAPRPIAMAIDLTDMLSQANNLQVPEGYSFKVTYKFQRWDLGAGVQDSMFAFKVPDAAKRYDSVADYLLRDADGEHPLLGKPSPQFKAQTLDGKEVVLAAKPEEVFVLDFWASWCMPCVEALPEMAVLGKEFSEKGVRFYAVNLSEPEETIEAFLKDKGLDISVILDPDGSLAVAFAATTIPQTVLIGKDGRIEAIHLGFDSEKTPELLRSQVESLLAGRRLQEAGAEGGEEKSSGQESGVASEKVPVK